MTDLWIVGCRIEGNTLVDVTGGRLRFGNDYRRKDD